MLDGVRRIHFIGIGGIGVSAVARIALGKGFEVTGSDVRESQLTRAIADEGAEVHIGHSANHIAGCDLVAISTAIPADNIERIAAKEQGIPTAHRSELLAALTCDLTLIGVTGTHGKGTTAAMITWILDQAGWEPGFVIGGLLHNFDTNARLGGGKWMVLEVDESDGSHHRIPSDYLLCNFLEADHLNFYSDLDDIIASMADAIDRQDRLQGVYANGDCKGNRRLAELVGKRIRFYGVEESADLEGSLDGSGQLPTRFDVTHNNESLGRAELSIPGRYNVTNALGALAVATDLGVPFDIAAKALASFKGLENRFSIVNAGGLTIVKDYISHPTGMRRVLESASDLTEGRIFSVWKPYRYTLLNYLQDEYASAFEGSHEVLITTMYAAEEDPIPGIDTQFIVDKIQSTGMPVCFVTRDAEILPALEKRVKRGDKVIFFGGDDFFEMADGWAENLARSPLTR